jgi:NAD/NADP transhydrogenase beta subunit
MQFSMQAITFLIGLALIVVGIFGGGIEVKEIKIPTLPTISRILSSIVGLVLIAVCLAFPQLLAGPQPTPPACFRATC